MASSNNLMTMEHLLTFCPTFGNAWISDMYANETEDFMNARQRSFDADGGGAFSSAELMESILVGEGVAAVQTPTASGCSENDAASAIVSKPRRGLPPPGGRVTKRKSRASKRSTTTFFTANAANFRQMVQQVTGVRFPCVEPTEARLLKPEHYRVADRMHMDGVLPTLDASAFLLHGSASCLVAQPPAADVRGLEFDPVCSFPTLESWKVI